jgi:peptidylprolyl isomerase
MLALAAPAAAQEPEPPTPASVVAAAPASDWRAIEPADLLVMDLAPDREGKPRRVVIQLMPPPFSQGWVGNIRMLAKAHWWDGTSVYRVVDNWVAQWGDGEDDEAKAKPLPEGLRVVPESEYVDRASVGEEGSIVLWEPRHSLVDTYSDWAWFEEGWPIAHGIGEETRVLSRWPTHCYGSVGVARDIETTGTGAELYAVIGHAPRQLDRNIAVVGRVIEGIEHLSTLPRGKGEAGVYDDPVLRVPIVSVRLGNEAAELPPPRFEYLASDSASFAEYVRIRANRDDAFYKVSTGGIDVCNVQVPIRRVPSE